MVKINRRRRLWSGFVTLMLWSGLVVAGEALAAQPNDGADRKPPPGYEKFEPAPESEQVSASNMVVLAYGAIFLGLFGYVVYVARSQTAMSKEMADLAARIDRAARS